MVKLSGLVKAASTGSLLADLAFYIKIDGNWIQTNMSNYSNLIATGSANNRDLLYDITIDYENETGSNQTLTEACLVAGDTSSVVNQLNSDQFQQETLFPIGNVTGQPITIVPQQIIRFTNIRLIVEGPED